MKVARKYLNPKTGETWSGHARPPAWIEDVKDRTKFLIGGADTASSTKIVGASGGKAPVRKVQSKGALPAKYRDAKPGATWSGRGPAPRWLASAKDRIKFLIEQASAAPADAPVRKATRVKAAPKVGAASKKVSAKKTAPSKKSAGVKKTAKEAPAKAAVAAKKLLLAKRPRKGLPATTATMPTPEAPSIASA